MSKPSAGFTLVELMVAIAVMAIMLAIAVPNFQPLRNSNRLSGAANDILTGLQLARAEAIRRNVPVHFCMGNATGTACSNAAGLGSFRWLVIADMPAPAADIPIRTDVIKQPVEIATSTSVGNLNQRITFRPDGLAYSSGGSTLLNGAFAACLPTTKPLENMYAVHVAPGGRMEIRKNNKGGVCTGGVSDDGT